MKVAPLIGAALVIYVAIPGSNQGKGEPKFCQGADGNRYKKEESYEDKENCIRYTCTKIQNKLKMKKENIIPCTGDISTIVEISQKTKKTITDTNLNTVINFNVHNGMGSDCYSKYSKIYPYPAATRKSLSECQTICTNNPECGAILMWKAIAESGGSTTCYMIKPNNLFNEGTCTWGSGSYNVYEKKFTVLIYKVHKAMDSSCYSKYTKISPYPAASSKSLSECQTICSDEPECGAILMYKSSVESGGTTSCYMIKPNNLFNEGTCTWGNGNYNVYEKKVTGCMKDDNIDYYGNDIPDKNGIVNGLEGCIKWCGDTTACKYWTFANSNQRCWLKTSDSGKRESSDQISGTKNCATVCTADATNEAACFCKSAAGGAGEDCTPGQKCNGDGTCQDGHTIGSFVTCHQKDCKKHDCNKDYDCCEIEKEYYCCTPTCPTPPQKSLTLGRPGHCGGFCSSNEDCHFLCPTCIGTCPTCIGICSHTADFEALITTSLSHHDAVISQLTPCNLAEAQALSSSCGWKLWLECAGSLLKGLVECAGSYNVVKCLEQLSYIAKKCWPCIKRAIG